MTKMLMLFGQDISELNYDQLHREVRSQKFILGHIRTGKKLLQLALDKRLKAEASGEKKVTPKRIVEDKLALADIYIFHLEALISEMERLMDRKAEPLSDAYGMKPEYKIKRRNKEAMRRARSEDIKVQTLLKKIEKDPYFVSWDRDKFFHIAEDRGYQTEEAVIADAAEEIHLDRPRMKIMLDRGRFTWGQVLCLGAWMQMTPREFCDTFLAGYFTEQFGEYRADYENVSKMELLKRAIEPSIGKPLEEVNVGSDGKAEDEEVWFD